MAHETREAIAFWFAMPFVVTGLSTMVWLVWAAFFAPEEHRQ